MAASIFRACLLATCFHAGFLLGLFFDSEDGGDMFLRNIGYLSTGLHGVISLKLELFISTAVRTSGPPAPKFFTESGSYASGTERYTYRVLVCKMNA
jgi:hypothetical protein